MSLWQKAFSRVLNFPYISSYFFPRTIFSTSSRLVSYTDKCMESSKHDWTLSVTAISGSNFFLKILFLVPNVSNSWILQKRFFKKIIWHRISIQTLLFQACLPTRQNGVENRDKAYCEYRLSKDCFRWSQRKKSLGDIWKPNFLFLFQNSFDTSQRKYSKR